MRVGERRRRIDALLPVFHGLWHPQPFHDVRPAWCEDWPALTGRLLALPDDRAECLNNDGEAALAYLADFFPELDELAALLSVPAFAHVESRPRPARWARDIPGRKLAQIEAFAASIQPGGETVLDWCGGKGHLGRLLATDWQQPVHTLEIDATLCHEGTELAERLGLAQSFLAADALAVADWPKPGQHGVALHACGELHRRLIERGADCGVARLDVAPCCYYRGVAGCYQPLSGAAQTHLVRDDLRLAVTETVTASPRLTRQRNKEMAWKLGFVAYRLQVSGVSGKTFKPVPAAWFRGSFGEFLERMARREQLPVSAAAESFEVLGWQRQREVMRLSVVRHAFRRALELWLVLDLAVFMENRAYAVDIGTFCERRLTPRNLMLTAARQG